MAEFEVEYASFIKLKFNDKTDAKRQVKEKVVVTVKEFAATMGLSVNELSETTGLSRQGLHDIIVSGYKVKDSSKRRQAVDKLIRHINVDYDKKLNDAETEHKDRVELLNAFY